MEFQKKNHMKFQIAIIGVQITIPTTEQKFTLFLHSWNLRYILLLINYFLLLSTAAMLATYALCYISAKYDVKAKQQRLVSFAHAM